MQPWRQINAAVALVIGSPDPGADSAVTVSLSFKEALADGPEAKVLVENDQPSAAALEMKNLAENARLLRAALEIKNNVENRQLRLAENRLSEEIQLLLVAENQSRSRYPPST